MTVVRRSMRILLLTTALLFCLGCGVSVRNPIMTGSSTSDVAIPKTAAVRTADDAAAIALQTAKTTLNSLDPHVIQVRLMVPDPQRPPSGQYFPAKSTDDPSNLVWVVDLDQDGHSGTPCPAPPPGIDQTICWYQETATIAISVMRGDVVAIAAPYPPAKGTPYVSTIRVPDTAKLQTRQDAMTAGLKLVPGQDGKPPAIIDVRLLSAGEWTAWLRDQGIYDDVSGINLSTPIWELEFTHAALAEGCTTSNAAGCVHDHLFLSLDALSGKSLGVIFPASGSPANFTP